MYYGVKFYSSVPLDEKPVGIPFNWPCECVCVDQNETTGHLYDQGYTIMLKTELEQYKQEHFQEYAIWSQLYYGEIR